MDVLIFGGRGLIGQALAKSILDSGDKPWIYSRSSHPVPFGTPVSYTLSTLRDDLAKPCQRTPYAVVNLAGESISKGRWSAKRKQAIFDSRVALTEGLANAILAIEKPPTVFVSGSAVGYYGSSVSETFVESSQPGRGFLPNVTVAWEAAAMSAAPRTRVALLRTGVVLSTAGGALPSMVRPYKFFVGGNVGSGQQWLSWIHIDDVVGIILHCIHREDVSGAINVTAPAPVRMTEFGQTIATVLSRPHWIPVPGVMMKLLFGDMAEIVLEGQRVLPNRMMQSEYPFLFPQLRFALEDILLHR